jgi:hypothetical protein
MNTPQFKPSVIEQIDAELDAIRRNQVEAQLAMAGYSLDVVMGLNQKKGQPNNKEIPSWLFKFAIEQNPNDPEVMEGIANALVNRKATPDEFNEFIRLAKKSPEDFTDEKARQVLSKTETHLLDHWFYPTRDWIMCLCFYTDNALSKMIDLLRVNNEVRLLRDTVAKTYKRMNLKKAPILLFKDVQIKDGTAIPVSYQNLLV